MVSPNIMLALRWEIAHLTTCLCWTQQRGRRHDYGRCLEKAWFRCHHQRRRSVCIRAVCIRTILSIAIHINNPFIVSGHRLQIRVCISFFNQNICCGYSKEPSHRDGSFEHPKQMFTLMDKKLFSFFRWNILPTPSPLLSLTRQVHVVVRALPGRTPQRQVFTRHCPYIK